MMRGVSKRVSASGSVEIERPVEVVFAFFADAENDPVWRRGVKSIRRLGKQGLGAVYQQTVAGPGGRGIPADIRIVQFEPQSKIVFAGFSGPVRPQGEYRFEPSGAGTRVDFELAAELSGIKALLMPGMVKASMDAEVAGLSRAKAHLEQS